MTSINIDKWRTLTEDLFKGYIYTYKKLSENSTLTPAKTLIEVFEELDIKKALTESGYGTAYTIAREIGIYYEEDNRFILSKMAQAYLDGDLTYSDYLKYYCLNIEFLINDEVIHPFYEILKVLKENEFDRNDIASRASKLITDTNNSSAVDCLRLFLNRCVDANLLKNNKGTYSLNYNYNILLGSINVSSYSALEFEETFIKGDQAKAQKNIVTKLLEREILNLFKDSFFIKKSLKKENELSFSEDYKSTKSKIEPKDFNILKFQEDCSSAGLIYSDQLITRFVSSLVTKPFVILSGLSGSGKSKLAEAFAKWVCEDEDQYALIPVGADWTNREPLLGYPNALKDDEYVKPDNDALDLLIRATEDDKKPYFMILDEMNLSHVERYFADFLSTMESNNVIPLHKINNEVNAIPQTIRLPKNLFIVGTVNIDETTYMFSPKVLDRANTIEFRVEYGDIDGFLSNPKSVDLDKLKGLGANMSRSFIRSAIQVDEDGRMIEENYILDSKIQETITDFFKELQKSGAEFGYRTAFEMSKLIYKLNEFNLTNKDEQLDVAIMQKMLPKLHGSRTKLSRTLKPLAKLCVINKDDFDKKYFENFKDINFKKDENIKYKLSFEKIMRLYNNAVENGFASYAEA